MTTNDGHSYFCVNSLMKEMKNGRNEEWKEEIGTEEESELLTLLNCSSKSRIISPNRSKLSLNFFANSFCKLKSLDSNPIDSLMVDRSCSKFAMTRSCLRGDGFSARNLSDSGCLGLKGHQDMCSFKSPSLMIQSQPSFSYRHLISSLLIRLMMILGGDRNCDWDMNLRSTGHLDVWFNQPWTHDRQNKWSQTVPWTGSSRTP